MKYCYNRRCYINAILVDASIFHMTENQICIRIIYNTCRGMRDERAQDVHFGPIHQSIFQRDPSEV